MKKFIPHYLPILLIFVLQSGLLRWVAAHAPIREMVTPFSLLVSALIFIIGLLPAFVRPRESHTIIACFAVSFAFFLLIPFELSDLPFAQPGTPLYQVLPQYLIVRLIQGGILLPMAIHMSSWFPRRNDIPEWIIICGYLLSAVLVAFFLLSSLPWQRLTALTLLLCWFTTVIIFFFMNLLRVTRDASPENLQDARRARIVLFSIALAEIPLWLRPFTLALGLDILPYDLLLLFQLFVPLGISYAIFQYDLFGIDRILRRTLAYGTVSLLLLTFYLALTMGMTELFADSLSSRPLAPLISLFLAALLFEPTRKLVQAQLDKLLYPDRLKFQNAIHEMQNSLSHAKRREEIVHLLNEEFPRQIGAEWGALKLFPDPDVAPAHFAAAWNTRLIAGNVSLGGYWLGARRAGPLYDSEERARLSGLAQQAALALAYANAYENLYELNQTLEARVKEQTRQGIADQKSIAAYEERQKIARDLHDSVTQDLFGMHLMARGLAAKSTPEMKEDLQILEIQARDTLKEMRLLLDQLRNDSGAHTVNLTAAIQGVCEAFAQRSGPEGGALLSITLDMPNPMILQRNLAEESLWIIREALQNSVKHGGGRHAWIEGRCNMKLFLTIKDDGAGFDLDAPTPGHYGLRGMRERAMALGGELRITSVVGSGTTIDFSLPLPRE
jgi:signal transduction histidine kinase